MISLNDIPVVIEKNYITEAPSFQVRALLEELAELISNLVNRDEPGYIDIRSIPLMPQDVEFLKQFLGAGEVSATVDALGETQVIETSIPAVWWIVNRNTAGEIISEFIEVATAPEILKTQRMDLHDAPEILRRRMDEAGIV